MKDKGKKANKFQVSSPRAWGCFLQGNGRLLLRPGLPHVRGGVSYALQRDVDLGASSPRAWGCFPDDVLLNGQQAVFPTCVGVFPRQACGSSLSTGLPHVRGGVSLLLCIIDLCL